MLILMYISINLQHVSCQQGQRKPCWMKNGCHNVVSVLVQFHLYRCTEVATQKTKTLFQNQTQYIQILKFDYYLQNSGCIIVHLRCRQVAIPGQCHLWWGIITAMKLHRFTYYSETIQEDSLQHVIFINVGQDPTQQTNAIYSYFIA